MDVKPVQPRRGDYITLIYQGIPSENHTSVEECIGPWPKKLPLDCWRIIDDHGEEYLVTRNPAYDCDRARAWVEYRPPNKWKYDLNKSEWVKTEV